MPRGGFREGAGRPSLWKSGCKFEDTKLIRVPVKIADQVLEYARRLDAGEVNESVTKSKKKNKQQQIYPFACPKCQGRHLIKDGLRNGKQQYACHNCRYRFSEHKAVRIMELETNSNIELLDQVNPLPKGSERSGEG